MFWSGSGDQGREMVMMMVMMIMGMIMGMILAGGSWISLRKRGAATAMTTFNTLLDVSRGDPQDDVLNIWSWSMTSRP